MDGDLAHLRTENEAADTDEVADVKQLFEYGVIQFRVGWIGADVVAGDVDLDAAGGVL